MILIWTVSPFITSYIIGNMFDILEKEMMRDYYFLTIVLFGINMFSIYIMKKAGIIDACTDPQKLDEKSNDWRSVFLWLNTLLN